MSDLNIENKVPAEYQRGIITDIFRDIQNAWNGLKTSFTTIALNIQSINSGQISGFRNSFVNGAHQVSQVNLNAAVTITAGAAINYAIDQWYTQSTGQNITAQRIAGTSPFKYGYKLLAGATGATTTLHGTRIEGKDCVKDVNQTKGISLWMTHDVARTVTWTAYYANTEDTFSAKTQIATGTLSATAARAQYFFSFNAGANAGNGLSIEYTTGALTNSTGYVIYEGNQNERVSAGATAGTSYEHVDYDIMLHRCQFYLPLIQLTIINNGIYGFWDTSTNAILNVPFPRNTRITPTGLILIGALGSYTAHNPGTSNPAVIGMSFGAATVNAATVGVSVASGGSSVGAVATLNGNASGAIYFTGAQL